MEVIKKELIIPCDINLAELFGTRDCVLRLLESHLGVSLRVYHNRLTVEGSTSSTDAALHVLHELISLLQQDLHPSSDEISLLIDDYFHADNTDESVDASVVYTSGKGIAVVPKTVGQKKYCQAIQHNSITFVTGPAGSGKTYLALAFALRALKNHEISRIILTRPVIEAGESLGFLPGTLQDKLDPYIRPLYDALIDLEGTQTVGGWIQNRTLEIAPLAYMRGRSLNHAFVILDEAQNTTHAQMKLFLTRLGFGSRFVITGDITQKDVAGTSGLISAQKILGNLGDIAFVTLDRNDIVRHSLVASIVDAYDAFEKLRP